MDSESKLSANQKSDTEISASLFLIILFNQQTCLPAGRS